MAKVVLKNLTKIFEGKVRAVDNVNLEVKDGEFMILLGPSGSGKTTLLRLIAGLEIPTSGKIYIGDKLVACPEENVFVLPKDRDVAMVFQNYALYPHMKVYDNIAFPLKVRKLPKHEIDKRVREVARKLQIEDLLDRYPRQLSGGQQQRVALARALVRNPKVFLFDEPLSNLDAKLRIMARAFLKKLQKELGVTAIYVTHDQAEAMAMADRIAIINEGKLQQVGDPWEVYSRPRNKFVAGFIGAPPMNLFDASLESKGEQIAIVKSGFEILLPKDLSRMLQSYAGKEVYVGIRPGELRVSKKKDLFTGRDITIKGIVVVSETAGDRQYVLLDINGINLKGVADIKEPLKIGDQVFIGFDPYSIYLFDKKTEISIIDYEALEKIKQKEES
ncbi:MAG: glycerol-3-phosphate ABC transporter ATP-binding protein [Thermoprotei archaeon]|nr:MAG: glycerol-3-phosphate ABC transporter ATP-binding protein [Thermoprotei archaeon]